ncbi:hypothetical protein Tco_0111882 [Tanacetum coccineum]
MQFWKIIRVGNYTEMYQDFEDMLKNFNRDDLVKLWSLVQERYNSSGLTEDKEIELWVELKMLFEPDVENLLELQKYMHDPLKWWLYDMCAVHYVNTGSPKFSTARPKFGTDVTKIERMKLEVMVEERRIFKYWFHYHTTNGHQFTMSNRHQELASPEQTCKELASLKQMALGIDYSRANGYSLDLSRLATTLNRLERSIHWDQQVIYSMAGEDEFHDDNPPPPPPPEGIKSRFGGNDESKKMQKYILKKQFESFSVSNSEGLHKGYDRFQSLLSQLEIHGASVSTEDTNQKFLRSLPASWSQVYLIMGTKLGVGTLSFDDLYNNLRVFKSDIKGFTASSSST